MGDTTMNRMLRGATLIAVAMLAGCATAPSGPRVTVLPGTGMSWDRFRGDEGGCRQYAFESIGGQSPAESANAAGVGAAVVGTAIGAVAGAAIGGQSGAAVGAGVGLLAGSASGTGYAYATGYEAQRRYDQSYIQCMYAKGHRVPVYGRYATAPRPAAPAITPPPPPNQPPPGYYPPPNQPPPRN